MFDISKPYQCKNGNEAAAIAGPDGRLFGWAMIKNRPGGPTPMNWTWTGDGKSWPECGEFDLVNTPETRTVKVWALLYSGGTFETYNVKQDVRGLGVVAQKELTVEFTIGEGLSDE